MVFHIGALPHGPSPVLHHPVFTLPVYILHHQEDKLEPSFSSLPYLVQMPFIIYALDQIGHLLALTQDTDRLSTHPHPNTFEELERACIQATKMHVNGTRHEVARKRYQT